MSKVSAIGLIVEDNTDFECIKTLIKRIRNNDGITCKKMVGNGCGNMIAKSLKWSNYLSDIGCNVLIIVHDLDNKDYVILKNKLEKCIENSKIYNRYICIPIVEIESWLISDPIAIKEVFNLQSPIKNEASPELLDDPKRKLYNAIYTFSNKRKNYVTSDNKKIAEIISIEMVKEKCTSFRDFVSFIDSLEL